MSGPKSHIVRALSLGKARARRFGVIGRRDDPRAALSGAPITLNHRERRVLKAMQRKAKEKTT